MGVVFCLTGLSLLIWLFLVLFWGNFWRCDQRLDPGKIETNLDPWPSICAIIPARDEAESIGQTVNSLLTQDYPGLFSIVLVDDQSSDGTAQIARSAADQLAKGDRLQILTTPPLPEGWSGKLWALNTGVNSLSQRRDALPEYVLLTDADIIHPDGNLKTLVSKAVQDNRELVSLMVQLHCQTFWEKALIPAFIFFFQKLYPFPWANNPQRKLAAAAGGCILLRHESLMNAGGLAVVKDALIDDCSLAAAIKHAPPAHSKAWGRIWVGLSTQTKSLRIYDTLDSVWTMVARTAFTQLGYSTLLLIGSVFGMCLVYLWPPLGVVFGMITGHRIVAIASGLTWLLMAIAYAPTIRLYRLNLLWTLALPLVSFLYTLMTIDSALRHWRGEGGAWKGRVYPAK